MWPFKRKPAIVAAVADDVIVGDPQDGTDIPATRTRLHPDDVVRRQRLTRDLRVLSYEPKGHSLELVCSQGDACYVISISGAPIARIGSTGSPLNRVACPVCGEGLAGGEAHVSD